MESGVEQNLSLYEDKLQFFLVCSPDDSQLSTHMQFAREKLEENVKSNNIKEVTPNECIALAGNFTKKHIVVFDEFEGECFETIRKTPALVLGARCVISCMMDNVILPYIDSPMYNLAMRDLIICLSSFDVQEKRRMKRLIGYMGGRCIDQLALTVTHLVTESVRTRKYEIAVMQNMKIMKAAWIEKVWNENLNDNILAIDKKFDECQLPIFYKLGVTTTGLTRREKKEVEDLVKQEGGNYFGEFSSINIDVVIAKKNATETPKLKAAMTQKKDCLCVEWITDSVKKGASLPIEDYRIDLQAKKHTSTPEKSYAESPQFENTRASHAIDVSNIPFADTINDTAMSNLSIASDYGMMTRKRKSNEAANENKDISYKAAYDKLDVKEAKRAGNFLDGCSVFVCGFSNEEKEKINKILNAGGATRFDTINSNVSHILIGSPSKKDVTMLQAVTYDAALVKLDWLVESIAQKTAADSDRFVYQLNAGKPNTVADEQSTAPSPATKRNILLMSQTSKLATPKRLDFDANESKDQSPNNESTLKSQDQQKRRAQAEDEIIDQYLKAPAPAPTLAAAKEVVAKAPEPIAGSSKANEVFKVPAQPMATSTPTLEDASKCTDFESESEFSVTLNHQVMFLANLKVFIKGFDIESHESLVDDCRIAGAQVIEDDNYRGTIDFLILPVDAITMNGINVNAKRIVNHNWLINAKRLHQVDETIHSVADPSLDIPYFYEPIFFPEDLLPLVNMNIVFSLYASDERSFLFQLAQLLGAEVQESFIRANKPLLVCPEARSAKYQAAIRWRLPVVNKNWLLDCYKARKRIALRNYLVGDSIAPVDDIDDDDEVLCSQSVVLPESARDSIKDTPTISNRRVEQLRGVSKPLGSSPDSPIIPVFNNAVLNELDTPMRNSILQRFKEMEDETPETKRRRYEKSGIKTPEEATTPYWMEYKRQQLEERRTRFAPTQEQIDKIKKRTPMSELTRRMWKEALGDEYESPSQCYNSNIEQDASHVNDSVVSRQTGRVLNFEEPATSEDTEADKHIQALADLISKGKQDNDRQQQQYADVPNTAPHESEMVNTEQHDVIGWRDPSEVVDDTPKRNPRKSVPCFSISCINDDTRSKIMKQIQALNGKICDNLQKYDSACTHFVCEKPSRSEKMLSCVAAGKWVLSLSYVEKSYEANRFLDEEEFEWGNPKAKNLPHIEGNEEMVAKAAHRWRKKLQSILIPSAKGIFKDFRVILKTAKNDSMRTLIEAGRGRIINVNADLPLDKQMSLLKDATHIICQQNHAKFTPDEIKAMDRSNVHRVVINYLQSYITNETTPDVKEYLFKSKS